MSEKVVTFGEIMLRLCPPGFERLRRTRSLEATYGGGEANVAASLASFGVQAEFVTRLPDNDLGMGCLAFLHQHGILTDHIIMGGDRMGIYFLETGVAQRPSKVLYDRAESSFATLQPGMIDWRAVFSDADWCHWTGITPAVSESAARVCKEAVMTAKEMGLTISCDLNYRAKLWKWTSAPGKVMEELVGMCDVAVGNEEDADKVFGIKASQSDVRSGKLDPERYRAVCEEIAQRLPNLKHIAITLRGSLSASHNTWSAVLWHHDGFLVAPVYDISPIVDRVGGGDAFSAGLIYGMRESGGNLERALRFASAASCLKHTIPGDFNAVSMAEVEQLMTGDASGRISR
ncbi:MAG: sugar kinase [Chloroflexi bacterium]|nr:sugar kinase [Chloroflexota bacterium]